MCPPFGVQGPVTDVIGIEYSGKSSQIGEYKRAAGIDDAKNINSVQWMGNSC